MSDELRERTEANMQRFGIPKGHDFVARLDNLICKCGHRSRQHDPEDGECDAGVAAGLCPCICFRSPDPNRTTNEYRVDAIAYPKGDLND